MENFPLTPEFSYTIKPEFSTIITEFDSGVTQRRARWPYPRLRWALLWKTATESERQQLEAFFRERKGAAEPFYYTPSVKHPSPQKAPTLGQTAGGSLGVRTIYAAFSWADDSGETQISSIDSLTVASGYLLTVTVPSFDPGVSRAWVYCGPSSEVLYKQSSPITQSGGTWTEPTDGYSTSGSSPPSENTLQPTFTVRFVEDSVEIVKLSPVHYRMYVELEQVFGATS